MKRCPHCSESVQNAATICAACGQDLPESLAPAGPGWGRRLLVLAGLVVAGVVGYRVFVSHADPRLRNADGACLLRARVYTAGEGTTDTRRILGLQNLDETDWTDVQVTISGTVTAGPQQGKPTGTHVLKLPEYNSGIAPRKARELNLDEFQSAEGPRWAAMAMKVRTASVTARIGRDVCTYATSLR